MLHGFGCVSGGSVLFGREVTFAGCFAVKIIPELVNGVLRGKMLHASR